MKAIYWILCLPLFVWGGFHLTWGVPSVSLDTNPPIGDEDSHPRIGIDGEGNGVAIWSRTIGKGTFEEVWVSIYHHASRVWSGPFRVSGDGSASLPQVILTHEGEGIVAWQEGFPSKVVYRQVATDGTFSPPLEYPPLPLVSSRYAQGEVKLAWKGQRGMAVWKEIRGGNGDLRLAQWDHGWKDQGFLCKGNVDAFELAINAEGGGMVVWIDGNSLWCKKEGQEAMQVDQGSRMGWAKVAIDDRGRALLVWNRNDQIVSQMIDETGCWTDLQPISDPAWMAGRFDLSLDEKGEGLIVFERYDVTPQEAPLNLFIASASFSFTEGVWTKPIDISTPIPCLGNCGQSGSPLLRINEMGDGVAIWREWQKDRFCLQGAGFSLGTWSLVRPIACFEVDRPSSSCDYDVGINLAGNMIALWPDLSLAPQIKSSPGMGLAIRTPRPPLVDRQSLALYNEMIQKTLGYQTDLPSKGGGKEEKDLPPCGAGSPRGIQISHRFPAHLDLINALCWESPGGVAYYRIYRGSLSNLIGTTKGTEYLDHQRKPHRAETYLITSVDENGQESSPLAIFVAPSKF